MRLSGAAAHRFCRAPDAGLAGALLHGPDAGLLSTRRRELTEALTGGDPMRLVRLDWDAVRRDPAALETALKARAFFADRQVVVIEAAKDALAPMLAPLVPGLGPEDAFLAVTATGLTARSTLRKLFEGEPVLTAAALYPDPPGAAELTERIRAAGGPAQIAPEAAERLAAIAAETDAGSLARFLETVALHADGARVEAADIAALAPETLPAELDALIAAVTTGAADQVAPLLARLAAGGTPAPQALGAVARHLSRLYLHGAGEGRTGPPGPRRDAMLAGLRRWPLPRLETACHELFEAERRLRRSGAKPEAAIAARALVRVAMMASR